MARGISNDDWAAKSFEAGQLFSPSAPIIEHDLFAGRGKEINKMLSAVSERGKHVVLFGERGVGKTSLAKIFSGLFPSTLRRIKLVREQVDPSDTFTSIWKKVFKDFYVRATREGAEETVPLSSFFEGDIFPDDVRREFEIMFGANDIPIIVIDEFDKSNDRKIHELMANTIKSLSDYSINATIVIVGVADDINDLIGEHPSISRCIEQIPMPRMNSYEMGEILDKRIPKLGMKLHQDARYKIIELARGLPAYVHLLGLYATQCAIERRSLQINEIDVDGAIQRTLERSQESIQAEYSKATHSNRKDSLYRQVLLACALAKTDERGQFTPNAVCAPLSDIVGREMGIDNFQEHLRKFITPERGSVLARKGWERAFKFRFRDPMMQPYVIMRGIEDKLVSQSAIKALSFPAEPEFDFPSEKRRPT
ncbi:AAA family ATPase [Methylocystis iwaonis]|uniref:nSTAND1 domain-containing NTPase n=1 Tax=Methylocystis iwaonis TaxID=2885079 RepID=UPI002E7ABA35|nr:AAA family ATPase [Methylocystis iwaonis]